ncbi:16S rRNA (cytidine(1402)-2'-O)-methyltransferase [Hydrogenothermus marinus]|uniref:Ribosomal RNA small subunit methyltransferase I n=1 Tax=Hydrogenothermus marinus TaxID=133270 RepID=A0A3M0BJ04_9AQUI|nr:16S rRNA (cytidine(1402)-2'-O)-methyltransferase [Hydrogenothermus marinus]RMA97137.1 16S rRNA (cytidine1402-2'-O)-methyltransferase [Hydrogenothermus marinus]
MATLYVVATPIGNLEDITFRAIKILKSVNYIACEDTRQTKKLLNHYGIEGKKLISYFEHNEEKSAERILKILEKEDVALVSDAGTPTLSDPGYKLVKLAYEKGFKVSPIPGAFAGATALSASGLPTDKFLFVGFLPNKDTKRKQQLEWLKECGITFILYESPKRVLKTLQAIQDILPSSEVVVAKELTKIHEEFIRGKASEIIKYLEENPDKLKGEFVIICYPEEEKESSKEDMIKEIKTLKEKGIKTKEIAKKVAEKYNISKKEAYNLAIEEENEKSDI